MVKINVGIDLKKYYAIILLSAVFFLLVPIYRTVIDITPGVTHGNHDDTITTPLPGNCPDCGYPDCGGCDGQPQLTLMPTEIIPTIPVFGGTVVIPNTPEVPHPTPCGPSCATVFPTFSVQGLPEPLPTKCVGVIPPTLVPADVPAEPERVFCD